MYEQIKKDPHSSIHIFTTAISVSSAIFFLHHFNCRCNSIMLCTHLKRGNYFSIFYRAFVDFQRIYFLENWLTVMLLRWIYVFRLLILMRILMTSKKAIYVQTQSRFDVKVDSFCFFGKSYVISYFSFENSKLNGNVQLFISSSSVNILFRSFIQRLISWSNRIFALNWNLIDKYSIYFDAFKLIFWYRYIWELISFRRLLDNKIHLINVDVDI